ALTRALLCPIPWTSCSLCTTSRMRARLSFMRPALFTGMESPIYSSATPAGKSTTTRLWTEREDVEVLSDDRIIVRRDDQPFRAPSAALGISAPGSDAAQTPQLRLRDRWALPIGHSARDDRKSSMRMYGTPWHGEAMYASPNSARLARIFVLEH